MVVKVDDPSVDADGPSIDKNSLVLVLAAELKDAAGAPVAGAFVQMKNAERRLNFMVITHEEGKFTNNRLPAGKYVVQAIGGEQQSALSAPVDVVAGKSASVDLSLTVARAPALAPAI